MKNQFVIIIVLVVIALVPARSFAQAQDDFEIVEAGQKSNTVTQKPTTAAIQKPVQTPTPQSFRNNQTAKSTKRRGVGDVQDAQMSLTGNLPLRVEVSDQQPNALITLAVGAATRFHSEEKPTRLVIGNLTDIGVTKAGSQGWYGFYLRPVTGGITTNMFIEFASGATVMINLKTVSPKLLKPGDYNSEVFVKTAAVRNELINLRKDNETLKTQLVKATDEIKVKEKEKAVVIPPSNISDDEMFKFIEISSEMLKRDQANFWKPANIDKLKISAISPLWEIRPGVGYVLIELENKGKTVVNLQNIEVLNGKAEVKKSVADLTVLPDKNLKFALKIEINSIERKPLMLRMTTAEGKAYEQNLVGFANSIKAQQ